MSLISKNFLVRQLPENNIPTCLPFYPPASLLLSYRATAMCLRRALLVNKIAAQFGILFSSSCLSRFTCCIVLTSIMIGCASRSQILSREYDVVSQQIQALEEERKVIVNLQFATKTYLQAKLEYEEKKKAVEEMHKQHQSQGLPTVSHFDEELPPDRELEMLKKQESVISDELRELEQKRSDIVKEQAEH